MRHAILAAAASLLLASPALAGVTYNGSSTIGQNILPKATQLFTAKTGIPFDSIKNDGSGKGVQALLKNEVVLAGVSRAPKDDERAAGLRFYTIGFDAISVIVHKDNPVRSLTKKQIEGIFRGEIRNWKEVGGKDAPIVPVTEILGEKRATQIVFTEIVMGTSNMEGIYGDNRVEVDRPVDEANYVAKNPNAVTAVSAAFVTPDHHVIVVDGVTATSANVVNGSYPISRPLNLVSQQKAPKEVLEFVKFMLTPEAQAVVAENFVPAK